MDFKRYVPAANEHVLVAVMIETKRGVENAAAIAATPGVDMVFIGTGDLALSLGVFPDLVPAHEAAITAVHAACRQAGTACGIFTLYSTMASDRRRRGFQCVVLGDDTTLLHHAFKQTSARFRARTVASPDVVRGAVALVTGTSRGIGPCLVRALLDAGAKRIYCGARDPTQTAGLVARAPDRLVPMKLDVTSDADAAVAAEQAGDVTLLVNNAGFNFNQAFSSTDAMANARIEIETNYFGPLRLCRAFAPVLRRNGGGTIVNMLSILAHMNLPMMGSLCASKAAALSLTQALRAELASQGTRVVGVLPGAVDTDMTRGLTIPKLAPQDVAAAVIDGLQRGLDEIYPGDMAAGVAFGLALDPKEVERQFARYLPPATG
jgi:NAD(P)-dependent dehydrogenase (short-subunit alcohol dehydrogenase family)